MTRSLKNKLSIAAALISVVLQARGKRKWALGLSLIAAGLQWESSPQKNAMGKKLAAKVLPETEPSETEGQSLSSADISSAMANPRLVH